MESVACRAYLATASCALVAYLLLPLGSARDDLYLLVSASGAIAVLGAVRLHRPLRRAPWRCLAAGLLLWSGGDVTYVVLERLGRSPYPSVADALYVGAYLLMCAAFVLLMRGRRTGRDRDGVLDSAIFTVGLGLLSFVLILRPLLDQSQSSLAAEVLGIAYPLLDLLLGGLIVRLVSTPGGRTPAFHLLVAGGTTLFVADSAFALLSLGSSSAEEFLDPVWLSTYVLWGAAALHPSMRTLSQPVPDLPVVFTGRRLLALTLAALAPPATLGAQLLLGAGLDTWAFVISSTMLSGLVITRMSGLLARLQEQAGELDTLSRTDALTGLPNRRSADAELLRAFAHGRVSGMPVVLAMIDLDHFKAFNDTFGHPAGDELLAEAALRWRRQLPPAVVLARYGGEEFLLIGPGLQSAAAGQLLLELREVTPARQTFSAGMAVWDGVESSQALVQRADTGLYTAKRGGRDRVVVAEPLVVG